MTIEIKIAEPHLTIHHDYAVLLSEPDGMIAQPSDRGLYFRDTRLISRWRLTIDGKDCAFLNSANLDFYRSRAVLTNPLIETVNGKLKEHTLAIAVSRSIGPGLHEDIDLTNHGTDEAQFNLEIQIGSDFADVFEVKAGKTLQRSGITTEWSDSAQALTNLYRHEHFVRGVVVSARNADSNAGPASFANGKITFAVALPPGGRWHSCLLYEFIDDNEHFAAPPCSREIGGQPRGERECSRVVQLRSASPAFDRIVSQAAADMMALRLHVPNTGGEPIPAGGVPWFLSLFGRDSIIASLQYLIADPEFCRGALDRLGSLQADQFDDFRDAEPGKIPHELRHGELAFFHKIPHTPYYGTADATPLYLILLHAAWKSTGDDALLHRHLGTAERCLGWIEHYGDRDGDGLQEYQTRSPAGLTNHGWKDAGDAVLYPDGSMVKEPRALCELQGYVFDAWLRMAEIFAALGDVKRAAELRGKAGVLYRRFNEAFWDEEAGFYALALDGDKQKVMTIASNPGHCLWSGIVPPERAPRLIKRLLQPDMWSGWGIRTLSSGHRAYNPFSYQNGSIWPHDNSIIAMGFKRYGFAREAAVVSRAICDAASYFMSDRLPELFAGAERTATGFPLRYLGSNVPQAWATGAIFAIVQALIGYAPDAPAHRLRLDPVLPDWLPRLDLHELHIGNYCIDLRIWRDGEATCFEAQGNTAELVIERTNGIHGMLV